MHICYFLRKKSSVIIKNWTTKEVKNLSQYFRGYNSISLLKLDLNDSSINLEKLK